MASSGVITCGSKFDNVKPRLSSTMVGSGIHGSADHGLEYNRRGTSLNTPTPVGTIPDRRSQAEAALVSVFLKTLT